ncbi:amino acid ABC transporter permease [Oceanibacterium hippocampi]|uniref:Inner membrane amino-acid ABC transporter permease protein YhdY n=1 Tax=Oceanibacterium hippocampi TaxID=745714 RepID=A0A1Y5T1C3_9PROT|nr:amino acid ABC transporter permease [Oceanibacterium hippocampi]SLN49909.1 Inner membrane amino-acid ABC transporter permease protein YhdY [Oceanibacterium hippocampi]
MTSQVKTEAHPDLPPPATEVGVIGWLRHNLFSTPLNTILTLLSLYAVYLIVPPVINWAFLDANIAGDSKDACVDGGACWTFVKVRFSQFMYGFYPESERWRVDLVAIAIIVASLPLFISALPGRKVAALFMIFVLPVLCYVLFYGAFGLETVDTDQWGGLMLTLILASVSIVVALPLGIVLALGRRSEMPIVRMLCVGFIELIRGVPLISVLFMSSVVLPLFLPEGTNFDKLVRALVGLSLFAAAYMAEVVRGGLQAIAKGQYEAASALGLSYWKSMAFIILPQALKIVIPGIVNTFIGLFKDTTLVGIIGLLDLLSIIQSAAKHSKWIGMETEGFVFAAVLYWFFCFGMSRYSIHIEHKLDTGHKS